MFNPAVCFRQCPDMEADATCNCLPNFHCSIERNILVAKLKDQVCARPQIQINHCNQLYEDNNSLSIDSLD